MLLNDLLDDLNGEKVNMKDVNISAVEFDSRKVRPGTLFIAVKGDKYDGHDFIERAIEKGAVAIIVQHRIAAEIPQYVVSDTRTIMGTIARKFYGDLSDMIKVAITGTNGKTTTAFLVHAILEMSGIKSGLIGTIYYIGDGEKKAVRTTPESLDIFRLISEFKEKGSSAVVMEVSSHGLALNRVDELRFRVAVFTNLSQDHLDFHKTIENYRESKMRIFRLLEPDGCAVFNIDDPVSEHIKKLNLKKVISYGMKKKGDLQAQITRDAIDGLGIDIGYRGYIHRVNSQLIGTYNAYNILAAFAVSMALGIDPDTTVKGIAHVKGVKGRMERITNNIFIDYAHTPSAIENALLALKQYVKGKLIVVFGCGGDRDKEKRPHMAAAATRLADFTIITSDNPRSEPVKSIIADIVKGVVTDRYEIIEDRKTAIKEVVARLGNDDILLVAGKGHEDYQVIGDKTIEFDDAEVIRECTANL